MLGEIKEQWLVLQEERYGFTAQFVDLDLLVH